MGGRVPVGIAADEPARRNGPGRPAAPPPVLPLSELRPRPVHVRLRDRSRRSCRQTSGADYLRASGATFDLGQAAGSRRRRPGTESGGPAAVRTDIYLEDDAALLFRVLARCPKPTDRSGEWKRSWQVVRVISASRRRRARLVGHGVEHPAPRLLHREVGRRGVHDVGEDGVAGLDDHLVALAQGEQLAERLPVRDPVAGEGEVPDLAGIGRAVVVPDPARQVLAARCQPRSGPRSRRRSAGPAAGRWRCRAPARWPARPRWSSPSTALRAAGSTAPADRRSRARTSAARRRRCRRTGSPRSRGTPGPRRAAGSRGSSARRDACAGTSVRPAPGPASWSPRRHCATPPGDSSARRNFSGVCVGWWLGRGDEGGFGHAEEGGGRGRSGVGEVGGGGRT